VVRWGVNNALAAAFLSHLIMWLVLMVFGLLARFRLAYYAGLVFILGCLLMEHWLARRRSLNWINQAFFRLNAVISLVFVIVTLTEIVFPFLRWVR
jgi:4-hydroxybenzoate polyprenyltransferase